jgi:hypothetical protein
VCRKRTPAISATALAIAGATSGVAIWPTPGDHLVGDAGECRHLGRDRDGWFVERGEDVPDADDAAVGQVVELHHPQFDDFVFSRVETRRLRVEKDAGLRAFADGWRGCRPKDPTSQNTVIRRSAQRLGHCG